MFFKKILLSLSIACIFTSANQAMDRYEASSKAIDKPKQKVADSLIRDMWLTIARLLPGDNKFLNELARQVELDSEIYQNIAKALLCQLEYNCFSSVDDLISRYFATTKCKNLAKNMRLQLNALLNAPSPYDRFIFPIGKTNYRQLVSDVEQNTDSCGRIIRTIGETAIRSEVARLSSSDIDTIINNIDREILNLHRFSNKQRLHNSSSLIAQSTYRTTMLIHKLITRIQNNRSLTPQVKLALLYVPLYTPALLINALYLYKRINNRIKIHPSFAWIPTYLRPLESPYLLVRYSVDVLYLVSTGALTYIMVKLFEMGIGQDIKETYRPIPEVESKNAKALHHMIGIKRLLKAHMNGRK